MRALQSLYNIVGTNLRRLGRGDIVNGRRTRDRRGLMAGWLPRLLRGGFNQGRV